MTISFSPQTHELIEARLKTGQYRLADEVIQAAMEALSELEATRFDEPTLDAIDKAEDQIERGQVRDWKDVREQVRAKFLKHN
jgi:Arc/MetJ-type ribon-helix-helix transcriptional regulator